MRPSLLAALALFLGLGVAAVKDSWQKPGCHKVGHTRKISIPECVEFSMTTNACRGFCESWAVPSPLWPLLGNTVIPLHSPGIISRPSQPVTSVGQCCNIMDTEDIEVNVLCLDGLRKLTFKSATRCSCYHCKKD